MDNAKLLDWRGKTCVVMASGPSLADAPLSLVRSWPDLKSIATNATCFTAPWADVYYGVDHLFWKTYREKIRGVEKTKCWTSDRMSAETYGINFIRQAARPGLGKREIQNNGNSGFGAINLAYLFGCRRILLAGFDMRMGPNGRRHHHEEHPHPLVQKSQFHEWLHKSIQLAHELKEAGCTVVNCTPGSALTVFKTGTLEDQLRQGASDG